MHHSLSLADSEVSRVDLDAGALRVAFSAAAVRREGDRGWLQGLALVLDDARVTGDATTAFGRVAEGHIRLDGRDIGRPVLPLQLSGDVELWLRFANGTSLAARGRALHLSLADDARFAEDLSC